MAKGSNKGRTTPAKDRGADQLAAGVQSIKDAMKRKVRITKTRRFCLDAELVWATAIAKKNHETAVLTVARTEAQGHEVTEEQREALEEARDALDAAQITQAENSIEFKAQALGRKELEDLEKEHKPTRKQSDELKNQLKAQGLSPNHERLRYNAETFPPALIAASVIEPEEPDLEDVKELWDDPNWSRGELTELLDLCYTVNNIVV